jgi:hypothetical protein
MIICKHCHLERPRRARGLCDRCWRSHRDAYPLLQSREAGPYVCVCPEPAVRSLEGVWGALGAVECVTCFRPPLEALRRVS